MAKCVYCDTDEADFAKNTPPDHFTDEHVIPRSIGGNIIQRNPFLLKQVCSWCNSLCGRYVDGRFARSWFTQMHRAGNAWKYVDVAQNPAVPLACLGTLDIKAPDGRECDAWLGPTGDRIFHFHHHYPDEPDQPRSLGRPIHLPLEEVDSGYVFLFVATANPDWYGTIFHSVKDEFEGAELYLVNANPPYPPPFVPIPGELTEIAAHLAAIQPVQPTFQADLHFADRFHAKVALGLGALYLTPDFARSPDAKLLRKFLFEKSDHKRATIPVHGTNSLEGSPELRDLLAWEDGHVIMLKPIGTDIALSLILFGQAGDVIKVSTNPAHWPHSAPDDGMIFVAAPGLQRAVGPIDFEAYVGWKHHPELRPKLGLQDLDKLKSLMDKAAASVPPK